MTEASKYCTHCGTGISSSAFYCSECGGEVEPSGDGIADKISDEQVTETLAGGPNQSHPGSITSNIGDVLFNKSLMRQLIDLELLLITGFTWITFLISEVIYHRWKLSRGEDTQYSYKGGKGEGPFTMLGKILFSLQFVVIALFIIARVL